MLFFARVLAARYISPPEAPTTAGRTPPTFVQKAFRLELDIPYRCQKS
jgi:hypothetical protein